MSHDPYQPPTWVDLALEADFPDLEDAMNEIFDVIAINLQTGVRRIMEVNKTSANADAIVNMAVARRGVGPEYFASVPAGSVQDGSVADEAEHEFCRRMEQDDEGHPTNV